MGENVTAAKVFSLNGKTRVSALVLNASKTSNFTGIII